ncbi:hypothetical protein ABL78_4963 [Leptomonas seymouri]|uniref:Uncharacterized protein n=1 Tax=Leptomonas seymouri TaxID=5684 RepID=A0A0N1HXH7_LEPSE|nr:hypothetical protein ABL78_4963 [Leptomonas seymouri]|eukprot:KPI85961.1 hypothetical protein ABL78_4963 [Leptomonas seymouri]
MEDHFIYARPVAVTEDKLKEALAKRANQKALKAALDQQVLETERLKAEARRKKGKKEAKPTSKGSGISITPPTLEGEVFVRPSPNPGASPAGPSPASPVPPPSSSSGAHAGPSSSIEPTRYVFSFQKGQGTFDVTDNSVHPLKETLQPSSVEGRARAGSRDGEDPSIPTSRAKQKRNVPALARRTPSSRDSARKAGVANGGRGRYRGNVGAAAAPTCGAYQTNSLPANFKLRKETVSGGDDGGSLATASRERVGSGESRSSRGPSREKGGAGGPGSGNDGSYDTQSLPVELIYKLSQGSALPSVAVGAANAGDAGLNLRSPLSRLKPPHPPRLVSPKRSPSSSRISDSLGLRSPMRTPSAASGSPGSAVRERGVQVSPRGGRSGRMNTPIDGPVGVRPSARPAGGILPPLSGRRESDVIEMSAIIDGRTPVRDSGGAGGAPRRRVSGTSNDHSLLTPGASPLSEISAPEQARRQAEREKGWAQQVKQLKAELRKARLEAAGRMGNNRADGAPGRAPRRAETAPDPPACPPGKAPRGVGGIRQRWAEGVGDERENVGQARPMRLEKMDFTKTHIFNRETFRPITAPEDASYFGGLLGPPPQGALLPLLPTRPAPAPASAAAGSAERETAPKKAIAAATESHPHTPKAVKQSSAHTSTLGDDSFKLASLTTRQVTLGLPEYGDGAPVPIQFLHLRQFVEAQIITASQAENLWEFFSLSVPVEFGGSGGGGDTGFSQEGGGRRKQSGVGAERYEGQRAGPTDLEEELESCPIEVEEVDFGGKTCSPHRGEVSREHHEAVEGTSDGEADTEEDEAVSFFTPYSPSHLSTNAVLAPALRRKISQLHSEEAALLLQQQQRRNGRLHPSVRSEAMLSNASTEAGAGKEERAVATQQRDPPHLNPPPLLHRDSEILEPKGTFDTYSELKLSSNVLPGGVEEEEL